MAPIDAEHHVARSHAALLGCAAWLHLSDFCRCIGLAEGHEENGQNSNRKHKVCRGSGSDDRCPLAEPLVMERDLSLRLPKSRKPRGRKAGARICIAKHLDVSAKRDRAEFPPCPGAVHHPNNSAPKPIEKTSTRTPFQRAIR